MKKKINIKSPAKDDFQTKSGLVGVTKKQKIKKSFKKMLFFRLFGLTIRDLCLSYT